MSKTPRHVVLSNSSLSDLFGYRAFQLVKQVRFSGNQRFRDLIREHKESYMTAGRNSIKSGIAKIVMNKVMDRDGRFLRKATTEEAALLSIPGSVDTAWILVVEEASIMKKVKQALRDTKPEDERAPGCGGPGEALLEQHQVLSAPSAVSNRSSGRIDEQVLHNALRLQQLQSANDTRLLIATLQREHELREQQLLTSLLQQQRQAYGGGIGLPFPDQQNPFSAAMYLSGSSAGISPELALLYGQQQQLQLQQLHPALIASSILNQQQGKRPYSLNFDGAGFLGSSPQAYSKRAKR
jgi:hypothetical protein